jgi:hypothetical protein
MADTTTETHKALRALGAAWRGDWNDFDGRTLRGQLNEIGSVLDGQMTADDFCAANEICTNGCGWTYHCTCATQSVQAEAGGSENG